MQTAAGYDLTLGRRYKKMHLPLDVEIYVLGVVGKDRCIVASEAGATGQRLLIRVNSEESRATELGGKGKWMLGLGFVCLIGAVLCSGSAGWLVWSGVHQVDPPREVLQGGSVW